MNNKWFRFFVLTIFYNSGIIFLSGFLFRTLYTTVTNHGFLFVEKITDKGYENFEKFAPYFMHQAITSVKRIYLFVFTLWAICLIIIPTNIFAQQKTNDTNDISVNATTYLFAYNMKFKTGSCAIGPTISLNTNGKLNLQFGLLYDFNKYIFYEKHIDYSTGSIYYKPVEHINLFIPLFLHYNYFNSDKITLYLTAGILFGGQNTINESNNAIKTSNFNFICGTGISYRPLKWAAFRISPTIRYNSGYFSPGISIDFSFLFNSKKLL